MTRSTTQPLAMLFCVALSLGAAIGASSSGCLLPEACILTISQGHNWCTEVEGALMWPAGQPELAEPVLYEGSVQRPRGCLCYNDAEQDILFGEVPADVYDSFVLDIELAARQECDVLVPLGWDHNCFSEDVEFRKPYSRGSGDCVGACHYIGPKCPLPGEINPYECEDIYGDGETGAVSEDDPPSTPPGGEGDLTWQL